MDFTEINETSSLLTLIFILLSGGGLGSIITGYVNHKKNNKDFDKTIIEKALKLEEISSERYFSVSEKLTVANQTIERMKESMLVAERMLEEADIELKKMEKENAILKNENAKLKKMLKENNIEFSTKQK